MTMLPYTLKKFIAQFLMPMPLVCELFFIGWMMQHLTRFKKTGIALKMVAGCLFLLFGYGFGRSFLYQLERQHPPFDLTVEQCEHLNGASVVVLGQGMENGSDLPLRYQNNAVFDRRLFEGVRVAKRIPESRLIVSLAGDADDDVKQKFLDGYMEQIVFPTNRVTLIMTARDTADEAVLAKQVIVRQGSNEVAHVSDDVAARPRCVIATSASHIPRAMKIFKKHGLAPIAAPCDYTDVAPIHFRFTYYTLPFPSGEGFEIVQNAAHEWMGGIYEWLTK